MADDKYSTTTVVFNLPEGGARYKKLEKVISDKISSRAYRKSAANKKLTVKIATDENDNGLDFGYIKHNTAQECSRLSSYLQRINLNNTKTFYLMSWQNLNKYDGDVDACLNELLIKRPGLNPKAYENCDKSKFVKWFENPEEMFILRHGDETEIYSFDLSTSQAILVNSGEEARKTKKQENLPWTYGRAFWSPHGTYIITTHDQGIRIWGDEDFHSIQRIMHQNVKNGLFSKNEDFLLTWNGTSEPDCVLAHNTVTGELLRLFDKPKLNPLGYNSWPYGIWSNCSKYLAYPCSEGIEIYDTSDMSLVSFNDTKNKKDAKDTKVNYINKKNCVFSWHNHTEENEEPILAIWSKASNTDGLSRLELVKIPSLKTVASKNIFALDSKVNITWQPNGEYCVILVKVQKKVTGKGKIIQTQLDVIQMLDKKYPISSYTCDSTILGVFCSESGNRFCTIHSDQRAVFHQITKNGIIQCDTITLPKEINTCSWSPIGVHFVLSACCVEDGTGYLWFGQCIEDEKLKIYTVNLLFKTEKNRLTNVDWDPSGRCVTASTLVPFDCSAKYKYAGLSGFTIYSFLGRPLYSQQIDQCLLFQWRPHPKVFISEATKKNISRNLKDYQKLFEKEDTLKRERFKQEEQAKMNKKYIDFMTALETAQKSLRELPQFEEWILKENNYSKNLEVIETVEEHLTEVETKFTPVA